MNEIVKIKLDISLFWFVERIGMKFNSKMIISMKKKMFRREKRREKGIKYLKNNIKKTLCTKLYSKRFKL